MSEVASFEIFFRRIAHLAASPLIKRFSGHRSVITCKAAVGDELRAHAIPRRGYLSSKISNLQIIETD